MKARTRFSILSFNTAIGLYAAYGGIAGIFQFGIQADALSLLLGAKLVAAFNIAYFLAGVFMLVGLATGHAKSEAAGLRIIIASVLVRSIAVGYLAGFTAIVFNVYVFNAIIVWACVVRILSLRRGDVLTVTRDGRRPV